jgi:HEAT repeats
MKRVVLLGYLSLLLGGCQPEPRYEGLPMSYYLRELKAPGKASRLHVVRAIAHFGPEARAAVSDLTLLLKDHDPVLRALAAQTLGGMGRHAEPALPALREMAEKDAYTPAREQAESAIRRIEEAE